MHELTDKKHEETHWVSKMTEVLNIQELSA